MMFVTTARPQCTSRIESVRFGVNSSSDLEPERRARPARSRGPSHGRLGILASLAGLAFLAACITPAQAPRSSPETRLLSAGEQAGDLQVLWKALTAAHVGLSRYESTAALEERFGALLRSVDGPVSAVTFFANVAAFNASVRSGHLYTIPTGSLADATLTLRRIPLYLQVAQGRLFVWRDVSDNPTIAPGSEVLAIDGQSASAVLARMLPHIPSDGYIETRKWHLINRRGNPTYEGFDLYYALHVSRHDTFHVRYRDHDSGREGELSLNGLSFEQKRNRLMELYREEDAPSLPPPAIRLFPDRRVALLSMPRSWREDGDPELDALMGTLLDSIRREGIQSLVIDVRGNNGGNDDHPSQVFKYLTDRPFRYYRGLLVKQIDFTEFQAVLPADASDRPPQLDAAWYLQDAAGRRWERRTDGYHLLQPIANDQEPFRGAVYVLADGGSFSSGSQFAALFHDRRRAILIGEETGGDYAGPDGGATLPIILPASGIMVRIPLIRSVNAFQPSIPGRGAMPACEIAPSIDDLLSGKDLHLELAFELIARGIHVDSFEDAELGTEMPAACMPAR